MSKRTKEVRDIVKILDDIIKEYKEEHPEKKKGIGELMNNVLLND